MALVSEVQPIYRPPALRSGFRRRLENWAIRFDLGGHQRRGTRFRMAALTLARTGIILIRGAAFPGAVREVAAMPESTWDRMAGARPGSQLPGIIVNRDDDRVLKVYKALVGSEVPVINVRYGEDHEMMDIFSWSA